MFFGQEEGMESMTRVIIKKSIQDQENHLLHIVEVDMESKDTLHALTKKAINTLKVITHEDTSKRKKE
jgi:hypothetical protein